MSAQELPEITPATDDAAASHIGPQMLTVASVSRDGTRMLLVDAAGNEFSVALATPPAPAAPAASGESRRSEKPMNQAESTLRPREIQNRIRSGESPEAVADAAGVPVAKIMPFAAPVIAEREHIAERAQKASVRRPAGEPGARVLGDAVSAKLGALDLDPELVSWDSWRRNDGRWTVVGDYATAERSGTAHLTFDPPGNFVSLDDDDARWLVGDLLPEPPAAAEDDLAGARERRLSAVPEPTIDLLSIEHSEQAEQPVEAYLAPEPPVVGEPAAAAPAEEAAPVVEEPAQAEAPARRTSRKKGRASVPSWDEIMFGGGSSD